MVVGIVFSDEYRQLTCTSPKFLNRYAMVMDLINAYGIVRDMVRIPPASFASDELAIKELSVFHSTDYIEALYNLQRLCRDGSYEDQPDDSSLDLFGLSYDCPGFPHVFDYALAAVRGSLACADALLRRDCQIAINWAGGWHHSKRSEASGFCYLNDIVLAIHRLQSHSSSTTPSNSHRVLYIDLDLHHGDGVEEAFWYSPRVVTFSVHHAGAGFFPGTGTCVHREVDASQCIFPCGAGRGLYSAFNLPLAEGASDGVWSSAVLPVLSLLHSVSQPAYIVVQCGADGLSTDPHRIFNLTNQDPISICSTDPSEMDLPDQTSDSLVGSYVNAIRLILSWNLPTLLLGGGGYNFADTARLWTRLTALAISHLRDTKLQISPEIPDHSFLSSYGPCFELDITSCPRIDRNLDKNVRSHHTRLLEQALAYARLNKLEVDETALAQLMVTSDEHDCNTMI